MRIAFLSPGHPRFDRYPDGGGTQNQIRGLALALANLGHDVHIVFRGNRHFPVPVDSGVRYHPIAVRGSDEVASVLLYSKKASTLLRTVGPEILHFSERFSSLFALTSPGFHYFYACMPDALPFYRDFAIRTNPVNLAFFPVKRRIEEFVMQRCDRILALTASMEEYLNGLGYSSTGVVPRGVDPQQFRHIEYEPYFLFAGRFSPVKNLDILLEAFATADEVSQEFQLLFVGEGPERSHLKNLAEASGISSRVKFLPWLPRQELANLVGRCRAFVLPSLFDTFPGVLLEAMASEKPVIASEIAGSDIVENGRTGFLFSPKDLARLREGLILLATDDTMVRRMGRLGRRKVQEFFTFAKIARRLERFYAQDLDGGNQSFMT